MSAMKAYRRANGLCYKCGKKWSPNNHTCPAAVSLHVVEELWSLFNDDTEAEIQTQEDNDQGAAHLLSLSINAMQGTEAKKTIRLRGFLAGQEILILVDSESSASFLSNHLKLLSVDKETLTPPLTVKMANGGTLPCSEQYVRYPWFCQGNTFYTNLKILPLGCYDMVLGMDWLEEFNPMNIDWKYKLVTFQYQEQQVQLQGVQSDLQKCVAISLSQLEALYKKNVVVCLIELCAASTDTTI